MPTLSPRQEIAARFAELLDGAAVERIVHGAGGQKHFYRVRGRVCVDILGVRYIVVDGRIHLDIAPALADLTTTLERIG